MLQLETYSETAESKDTGQSTSIVLATIFQSGCVLQRDISLPIWGTAAPGAPIRIELDGIVAQTFSHPADGRFFLRLPPHAAATGLTLTVEELRSKIKLTLTDIAVGEVYLCAGQSNMEFRLRDDRGGKEAIATADFPHIRCYQQECLTLMGEQNCCGGQWVLCSPETASEFSALGFYFGRRLHQELGVPVGLINLSRGGINLEAWVSRSSLLALPDYCQEILDYDAHAFQPSCYKSDGSLYSGDNLLFNGYKKLFPEPPAPAGEHPVEAQPDYDDSAWQSMPLPESWTLANHNHAGIFWYRKEIFLPENAPFTRTWTLGIGAADKWDETYVNGVKIGATGDAIKMGNWNTPRVYTLQPGLLKPGRNLIAVRVASMVSVAKDGGLIGPANAMKLTTDDYELPLTGVWKLHQVADYGIIGMTFMRGLGPGSLNSLHVIYDNALRPLAPYALRGALFYQGEANGICMARTYRSLLEAMINDWRRLWEQPRFDMFIIQLPEWGEPHAFEASSQWAQIREAQAQAAAATYSDLIVTTGYGDTDNIHPDDKLPVADQIAQFALPRILGTPIPTAPRCIGIKQAADSLRLTFNTSQLHPAVYGATLQGFFIAGENRVAYPAQATILNGSTIRVASPKVPAPQYVWYNWSDHPVPERELLAENDLPISTFSASIFSAAIPTPTTEDGGYIL